MILTALGITFAVILILLAIIGGILALSYYGWL